MNCHALQDLGPEHEDLGTSGCMTSLRQLGSSNWRAFTAPDPQKALPRGHLMTYPYDVSREGNVEVLSDCEDFPEGGCSRANQWGGTRPCSLPKRKPLSAMSVKMSVCQSVDCIASITLKEGRCLPF